MRIFTLVDGTIKKANDVLAKELIKRGARELTLKQIQTPLIIENNESRRSVGTNEVLKPARSRKRGGGKRKVSRELD
jgi:hypothetical protein